MVKYVLDVTERARKVPVDAFTEQHGLTLRVTNYGGWYGAHYDDADITDGYVLRGVSGRGPTPEHAIADYLDQINGQHLVVGAWTGQRREMQVPQLTLEEPENADVRAQPEGPASDAV